ncbi:MAG: hypothetical protein H6Q51_909 [Deltaproteobacteria bacterium]|nr:hypothetical protein [Deltaproteobacteria bacterium]
MAGAGLLGGLDHRTLLHLGDAGRNRHDETGSKQPSAVVRLPEEVLDHGTGDFEISDDSVLHGPDGRNLLGSSAEEVLGLPAYGDHLPVLTAESNDRWLVEHDTLTLHVDEGVGRAEIHSQILGKDTCYSAEELHGTPHHRLSLRLQTHHELR